MLKDATEADMEYLPEGDEVTLARALLAVCASAVENDIAPCAYDREKLLELVDATLTGPAVLETFEEETVSVRVS